MDFTHPDIEAQLAKHDDKNRSDGWPTCWLDRQPRRWCDSAAIEPLVAGTAALFVFSVVLYLLGCFGKFLSLMLS
jgi:hypothetical protein